MAEPQYLVSPQGRRLAYAQTPGRSPGVVFLGGFRSDMSGTKALHLEGWAGRTGRAFLRLDYSGHGLSGGGFEEGSIGDWFEDARAVLSVARGRQVLVGSSMGGWIALLLARERPEAVAGLVTIAAAPDFTEAMWAGFDPDQRAALEREGRVETPSDYSEEPYVITRRLIEEGRRRLVLRTPLRLPFPVRLLQGTADADVEVSTALRLLDHVEGEDIRLNLVKGADHRFSTPELLVLIEQSVEEVLSRAEASA